MRKRLIRKLVDYILQKPRQTAEGIKKKRRSQAEIIECRTHTGNF